MMMIILKTTNVKYKKFLPIVLVTLSFGVFLIAGSPGILDIYYKEVSFKTIDGVSYLIKDQYGSWHIVYTFYLVGYFGAMIGIIIAAFIKKTTDTITHSFILASSVFVNILVWAFEKFVRLDFEILSISYIISELFLLGLHCMIVENKKKPPKHNEPSFQNPLIIDMISSHKDESEVISKERFETFRDGIKKLTKTELTIYNAYVCRATSKEIMTSLNITENTLKFHNKNIYSKLGIFSRKELLEIHKQINL